MKQTRGRHNVGKWWMLRQHLAENVIGCCKSMVLHPLAFPRILRARWRFFRNRYFEPLESMHGFDLNTTQAMLSYWDMFVLGSHNGKWMRMLNSRTYPIVVDVGANRGVFGQLCRQINFQSQIHAFEPQASFADDLTKQGFKVYSVALSNKPGEVEMFTCGEGAQMDDHFDVHYTGRERCKVATLDSYNFMVVNLLKIDVDGHLLEVLQGATETLKRTRCVIAEIMDDAELEEASRYLTDFPNRERLGPIDYCFWK